jgi:hypothetical protein
MYVAKKRKVKTKKEKQTGAELVDNCDHCGKKLEIGRIRTVGSAICAGSGIGGDKTHAIFWQKKGTEHQTWYFFDSYECRDRFKEENSMPIRKSCEFEGF